MLGVKEFTEPLGLQDALLQARAARTRPTCATQLLATVIRKRGRVLCLWNTVQIWGAVSFTIRLSLCRTAVRALAVTFCLRLNTWGVGGGAPASVCPRAHSMAA